MDHEVRIQYVGFKTNLTERQYTFNVRDSQKETHEFTLVIANEAFNSRRARFQDGPDICSHRLLRELANVTEYAGGSKYAITDADLEDYRTAHDPKPGHRRSKPIKPFEPSI